MSMTIISSGGFLPVNELSSIINSSTKEIVLSLLCLISFFSIFLTYNLIFFKKKNINFLQEDFYLFLYLLFIIILFFLFFNFDYNFSSLFLSVSSSISNMGISIYNTSNNLSIIFLILTFIGGSFFSTSSGIRFIKLYFLFKYALNNLISNVKPKNVFANKSFFFQTNYNNSEINKYFLSFIILILSLFFLTSLLTLSDISLENSFKLSILTIMNTVNSSIHGINDFNFESLHYSTKNYLIFFMIIGRIELLTLFVIVIKFFFNN